MLNKKHLDIKKVRGQEEPATKSSDIKKSMNESATLISARAKKFIPCQPFVTNFYFKSTQQFTPQVTKPIMIGKHPVNCCVPLK